MTRPYPSTHPSPPTHQTIHPSICGEFFTNFKSLNRIEISWLVQVLSNFYWFQGSTPSGVADGWMGVEVGIGVWGSVWCTLACTYMHTHMHMHVEHDKHARHGCLHVGSHLQFLYMYTCVCVYARACACMWRYPPCPQMPPDAPRNCPPTCPLPRAAGSPKTPKFNKTWTNRDNLILFEDSLPLHIPELI